MKNDPFQIENAGKAAAVCFGGLCASIAVILQSAPLWLPGAGLLLSALSSVPVSFASARSPVTGALAYICAAAVLAAFSVHEALIFACATGLLGFVSGALSRKKAAFRILASAALLSAGIAILLFALNIAVFGPLTSAAKDLQILFVPAFSLGYAFLYGMFFQSIFKRVTDTGREKDEQ